MVNLCKCKSGTNAFEDQNVCTKSDQPEITCNIVFNQNELTLSGCVSIFESEKLNAFKNTATKIIIEEGIKTIGLNSFKDFVAVEEIEIGKDVWSIDKSAFIGCTKLKTVIYLGNKEPTCPETLFNENTEVKTITVPNEYESPDNNFCGKQVLRTDINGSQMTVIFMILLILLMLF